MWQSFIGIICKPVKMNKSDLACKIFRCHNTIVLQHFYQNRNKQTMFKLSISRCVSLHWYFGVMPARVLYVTYTCVYNTLAGTIFYLLEYCMQHSKLLWEKDFEFHFHMTLQLEYQFYPFFIKKSEVGNFQQMSP